MAEIDITKFKCVQDFTAIETLKNLSDWVFLNTPKETSDEYILTLGRYYQVLKALDDKDGPYALELSVGYYDFRIDEVFGMRSHALHARFSSAGHPQNFYFVLDVEDEVIIHLITKVASVEKLN